jgi:hypothetical protein
MGNITELLSKRNNYKNICFVREELRHDTLMGSKGALVSLVSYYSRGPF